MVPYTSNPSTLEADAGGLRVGGQSELHWEILTQKNKGWGEGVWLRGTALALHGQGPGFHLLH
jgi:hypothetical protein